MYCYCSCRPDDINQGPVKQGRVVSEIGPSWYRLCLVTVEMYVRRQTTLYFTQSQNLKWWV